MQKRQGCHFGIAQKIALFTLAGSLFLSCLHVFAGDVSGNNPGELLTEGVVAETAEAADEEILEGGAFDGKNYQMIFNGNGYTDINGNMPNLWKASSGAWFTLLPNRFVKYGYYFTGWNTKADGTGKTYLDKQEVKFTVKENVYLYDMEDEYYGPADQPVVLYAQWKPIHYTIAYHPNGGVGAVPSVSDRLFGQSYTLAKGGYSRVGYTLTGWNTKADGTGKNYGLGGKASDLTIVHQSTVTLYAVWKPITYTVTFHKGEAPAGVEGIAGSMKKQTLTYDEPKNLPEPGFKIKGYYVTWYTKEGGKGKAYKDRASVVNLASTSGANVDLYAKWSKIKYKVVFDKNRNGSSKVSGSMKSFSMNHLDHVELKKSAFKRPGFYFTGWNTSPDGKGKAYSDGQVVTGMTETPSGTVKLYAQWEPYRYDIVFERNDMDGGSTYVKGNMKAKYHIAYNQKVQLEKTKFKREGYLFKGYTLKADGSGKKIKDAATVSQLTQKDKDTVHLFAKWKPIEYTIIFNANGGRGRTKSMKKCAFDKAYTLTANGFSKTDKQFVGWNTKKNGKGKSYQNGETVKNLKKKDNEAITLYAQWK